MRETTFVQPLDLHHGSTEWILQATVNTTLYNMPWPQARSCVCTALASRGSPDRDLGKDSLRSRDPHLDKMCVTFRSRWIHTVARNGRHLWEFSFHEPSSHFPNGTFWIAHVCGWMIFLQRVSLFWVSYPTQNVVCNIFWAENKGFLWGGLDKFSCGTKHSWAKTCLRLSWSFLQFFFLSGERQVEWVCVLLRLWERWLWRWVAFPFQR